MWYLTWNTNGTLATLAITDPFNSANAQTCTFGYDDLARISSANCGTAWSQTFSLDPFGNASKTGNPGITFTPGFDQTKNWFLPVTGFDNNGNLLSDVHHAYSRDAEIDEADTSEVRTRTSERLSVPAGALCAGLFHSALGSQFHRCGFACTAQCCPEVSISTGDGPL